MSCREADPTRTSALPWAADYLNAGVNDNDKYEAEGPAIELRGVPCYLPLSFLGSMCVMQSIKLPHCLSKVRPLYRR
jgi:hypothetical protein